MHVQMLFHNPAGPSGPLQNPGASARRPRAKLKQTNVRSNWQVLVRSQYQSPLPTLTLPSHTHLGPVLPSPVEGGQTKIVRFKFKKNLTSWFVEESRSIIRINTDIIS